MNLNSVLSLVLAALVAAGKPKALELLQNEFVKNPHDYKALLYSLNAGMEHLKTVTEKTATSLDDTTIADVQDILSSSAQQNGLTL